MIINFLFTYFEKLSIMTMMIVINSAWPSRRWSRKWPRPARVAKSAAPCPERVPALLRACKCQRARIANSCSAVVVVAIIIRNFYFSVRQQLLEYL